MKNDDLPEGKSGMLNLFCDIFNYGRSERYRLLLQGKSYLKGDITRKGRVFLIARNGTLNLRSQKMEVKYSD